MVTFNPRKLEEWCRDSGKRHEEICFRAGISTSYLRAMRYGDRVNPSADVLARLAGVLGRDVGELFTDDAELAGAR